MILNDKQKDLIIAYFYDKNMKHDHCYLVQKKDREWRIEDSFEKRKGCYDLIIEGRWFYNFYQTFYEHIRGLNYEKNILR